MAPLRKRRRQSFPDPRRRTRRHTLPPPARRTPRRPRHPCPHPPRRHTLAIGLVSLLAFLLLPPLPEVRWIAATGIIYGFFWSGRVLFQKARRVYLFRKALRRGLGTFYSGQATFHRFDISADTAPTILKVSRELEALGASHVCDFRHVTRKGPSDGNRAYALADASIGLGFLRKAENLLYFPPKPIIVISTRFTDGKRHFTSGRPRYRKSSRPEWTGRCVLDNTGIAEMLASHQRHVARIKSAGSIPIPAPTTTEAVLERHRVEFEEGQKSWQKSPYSWFDALHQSFKICRREYLDD
jgi:hypothetical protein